MIEEDVESDDKSPELRSSSYVCPHCGVLTHHIWNQIPSDLGGVKLRRPEIWWASMCMHCRGNTVFRGSQFVYPVGLVGPLPAADMPPAVREVYEEARAVASASPRAAAALLRVAIEILVNDIEPGSGKLFVKIGKLVGRGLDPQVQRMLDSVRVFGNEGGAHPGEINMQEQSEMLQVLMFCVNTIVERIIAYPKQIAKVYEHLSPEQLESIATRDSKANKG